MDALSGSPCTDGPRPSCRAEMIMTSETGRGNQGMAHPGLASAWLPWFTRRAQEVCGRGRAKVWDYLTRGQCEGAPHGVRPSALAEPRAEPLTAASISVLGRAAWHVAACGILDPDSNVGRVRDRQRSQLAGEPPPFCPPRVAVQVLLSGTDGEHECNAGRPALYWEDYRFAPKCCGYHCAIQVRLGFLPRSGFLPRPR